MAFEFTEPQRRWIDALRSGKYKQTSLALSFSAAGETPKYCCLGVACDLFKEELGLEVILDKRYGAQVYNQEAVLLPGVVKDYLNLRSTSGLLSQPFVEKTDYGQITRHDLTNLNDNGFTFTDIADVMEFTPELVFTNND